MNQIIPVLGAVLMLAGFGIGEAWWTNRWNISEETERAVARLSRVPKAFGEWDSKDEQLDPRHVARAEMSGYLLRRYFNSNKKTELTVLLVCGRTGPTSVHGPEVCYSGAGYNQMAEAAKKEIKVEGLPTSQFRLAQFQKNGVAPDPLRIFWSWNATGQWETPASPRFHFGRFGSLYKLYVIRQLPRFDEPLSEDPAPEFLNQFLPVVHEALFKNS